jgi:hypothetical protein
MPLPVRARWLVDARSAALAAKAYPLAESWRRALRDAVAEMLKE